MSAENFVLGILLAFLFMFGPLTIARLSNLAGSYRLAAMVTMLVFFWAVMVLVGILFILVPMNVTLLMIMASTLGATVMIVIPLIFGGQILARIIALRYAPSVADAISAVIVGGTASFITPVISTYLFLRSVNLFTFAGPSRPADQLDLPSDVAIPMLGLLVFGTVSCAWIMMGWGSMSSLRRRKGTVVGLVSVTMAFVFSIVLMLVVSQAGIFFAAFSSVDAYSTLVILLIGGAISILHGMLTAGFMSGILGGLASVFDLIALLLVIFFLIMMYSSSDQRAVIPSYAVVPEFLFLVVFLSIIQIRTFMFGNRVISMMGSVMLPIPFLALILRTSEYDRNICFQTCGLVMFYIVLVVFLAQWAPLLRNSRYGMQLINGLWFIFLMLTPLIYMQ